MRIRDYVTGRVLAWAAIAILGALFGASRAHAQVGFVCDPTSASLNDNCIDEGRAFLAATSAGASFKAEPGRYQDPSTYKVCITVNRTGVYHTTYANIIPASIACNTDATAGGQIARQWPAESTCATRPNRLSGWQEKGTKACDSGCERTPLEEPLLLKESLTIERPPLSNAIMQNTQWGSTGATCGGEKPPPGPPKDNFCQDLPMGHKFCRNNKGQNCVVSGTSGRTYCPGKENPAVGPDRTDGATANDSGTPGKKPENRPGEDWQNQGTTTVSSTSGGNTTISNVTNVSNGGSANTNPGQGTPGDGSGNPGTPAPGSGGGSGEGEGDEDEGTATDPGDCALPPSCIGKSTIQCAVFIQIYKQRCEGQDKATLEGNAASAAASANNSQLDAADQAFDYYNEVFAADGEDDGEEGLDFSGFGFGQTCPEPPEFFGDSIDISALCAICHMIGLLVVAVGVWQALQIIAGDT